MSAKDHLSRYADGWSKGDPGGGRWADGVAQDGGGMGVVYKAEDTLATAMLLLGPTRISYAPN
jgi:hypothetical protein